MNIWSRLPQVVGSKYSRLTLTILCQVILVIFVVGLSLVDGKGGRGGGFGGGRGGSRGGGWGRSTSSGGGFWSRSSGSGGRSWFGSSSSYAYRPRGSGYYYGRGGSNWGLFAGLAWWTMATRPRRYYGGGYANRDSGSYSSGEESPVEEEEESADWLLLLAGIGFLVCWLFSFIIRVTFKRKQYHQDKYADIQFLAYTAYLTFIIVVDNIPIDGEYSGDDAWSNWFDNSTTYFVELGQNPLSGFDAYSAVIGFVLSAVILIRYVGFCRSGAVTDPVPKNLPTQIYIGFFILVGAVFLIIGITWSWKFPLIFASVATIIGIMTRYIGMVVGVGVLDKGKDPVEGHGGTFVYRAVEENEVISKCYWHDGLDLLGGLFSVIFHVRMAILLEDWGIFIVNFAPFCVGALALIFNPILICLNYCRQRKSVLQGANYRATT